MTDFHKLTSEDIFNLIDEKIQITANMAAEKTAAKLEPLINCSNECRSMQPSLYWWTGVRKFFFDTYAPYTLIVFYGLAAGASICVVYLMFHLNIWRL